MKKMTGVGEVTGKKGNTIVSFSVPTSLVEQINEAAEEMGYTSRSELMRNAFQLLVEKHRHLTETEGPLEGVLVVYYDHHAEGSISRFRHGHESGIHSFTHGCLPRSGLCMDMAILSGDAERVHRTIDHFTSVKGVHFVEFVPAPLNLEGCCR